MTLPGFPCVAILATVAGRHPPHSFTQDTRSPDTVQCQSQELSWSWLHVWKPSIWEAETRALGTQGQPGLE